MAAEEIQEMKAIIVDDERLMIHKFLRLTENITDLDVIGRFEYPAEAIDFMRENPVEAAFLDVEMPEMSGIELAKKLRAIRNDILIVFITAYDYYIRESNRLAGDDYIIKPYTAEILERSMDKLRYLASRQCRDIYRQN